MTAHQFLWLDLETTGLDPECGRPLEFAAVLCEDGRGDDLAIVQQYSSPIHWPAVELSTLAIDDRVMQMHTSNGLWHAVEQCDTKPQEVDEFLNGLCSELLGDQTRGGVKLAGNSIQFDRRWCNRWFPQFASRLHHQQFDVRTLMTAAELWCPAARPRWAKPEAHRALPDIQASIENTRIARKAMRGLACG